MIKSSLGEVQLTKPNYKLCSILSMSKDDVDMAVEAILGADLTSIIGALANVYGVNKALDMWIKATENL